jgi:hypothetical protein
MVVPHAIILNNFSCTALTYTISVNVKSRLCSWHKINLVTVCDAFNLLDIHEFCCEGYLLSKWFVDFFFFFGVTVSCLLSRCSTMWTKLPTLSVIVVFQIVSCVFAPSSLDMILLYAFCIGWWQIPVTKLSLLVKMGWPQTEPPDLCLPSSKDYSMSPTLWKLFFLHASYKRYVSFGRICWWR